MQKKRMDILTRARSTGVLTNSVFSFWGCFYILHVLLRNTKIVVSTPKNSVLKTGSKVVLETGPSMLRNKIGPAFKTRNGSFFWTSSSFCRENEISKTQKMDPFLTYIYIYIERERDSEREERERERIEKERERERERDKIRERGI